MLKYLVMLVLFSASVFTARAAATAAAAQHHESQSQNQAAGPGNVVVRWNKALLAIVRTPGAQPATVHPTRSFAILHAAIYDAVNAIDGTHRPYLVHLTDVSRFASQEAAAASAAHDVLVILYPKFQAMLDDQLQQSLSPIPDSADKNEGIAIGKSVADDILVARQNDGSNATPPLFVFTNPPAPGQYQSTPPNFPKQPQFTHWSHVTPFALQRANQFRPGPPPALASDTFSDAFNEVKSLGIANSTTATETRLLRDAFGTGPFKTTGTKLRRRQRKRMSWAPRAAPGFSPCST